MVQVGARVAVGTVGVGVQDGMRVAVGTVAVGVHVGGRGVGVGVRDGVTVGVRVIVAVTVGVEVGGSPVTTNRPVTLYVVPVNIWYSYSPASHLSWEGAHSEYA